jgi:hypothetical protein
MDKMRPAFIFGVFAVAGMALWLGCAEQKPGKEALYDHYMGAPSPKQAPSAKPKDVDFGYNAKTSPVRVKPAGPSQAAKPGFFEWLFSPRSNDSPFASSGAKPAPKMTTQPAPLPLPQKNLAPSGSGK